MIVNRKTRLYEDKEGKDFKAVRTGLRDELALGVIKSVQGQLSDGIWENSPAMEKYWRFFDVDFQGGEVVILISKDFNIAVQSGVRPVRIGKKIQYKKTYKYLRNGFSSMSDVAIKKWFATKIKQIVKEEEEDSSTELWSRTCTEELEYFRKGICAKDAYRVYDALLGRFQRVTDDDEIEAEDVENMSDEESLTENLLKRRMRNRFALREARLRRLRESTSKRYRF